MESGCHDNKIEFPGYGKHAADIRGMQFYLVLNVSKFLTRARNAIGKNIHADNSLKSRKYICGAL